MVWAFRIASGSQAGAGHIMRGIALATALAVPVRFYLDPGGPWLSALVANGFEVIQEPSHQHSPRLISDLEARRVRASLFDGYEFALEDRHRAANLGLLVEILDGPDKGPGHALVAPGLNARAETQRAGKIEVLAGPKFAMLHPNYARANERARGRQPSGECRRLLIQFGATDSGNVTCLALNSIAHLKEQLYATVVLGNHAPHLALVRDLANHIGCAEVLTDVKDMIGLYEPHDLAIGSAGVSLLERMCCGVPSIVLTTATNQISNAQGAQRRAAAVYLGAAQHVRAEAITGAVTALAADPSRRDALRQRGIRLVDGRGAGRVAQRLNALIREHAEHSLSI